MATRWKDTTFNGQMEITDVAKEVNIVDQKVYEMLKRYEDGLLEDKNETRLSYINWQAEGEFESHETIMISNETIKYNVVRFSFQKKSPGIEDSTNHDGFIIIYFLNNNLYYITSRNSDAKTIIRKLLGYTGKEEIIEYNHEIKSDLIFWMIHKVYTKNNTLYIDGDNRRLTIDGIKYFKGNSQDALTTVTADGESVMNIISTMSFLLERGKINSIIIDVSYDEHDSIEIVLGTNNYISINMDTYAGKYNKSEYIGKKEWLLYILLYIEILTDITQVYMDELESETWNEHKYKNFLKDVADDLMAEVQNKLQDLETNEDVCENVL